MLREQERGTGSGVGCQQCIYPPLVHAAALQITQLAFHRFLLHHFPSVWLAAHVENKLWSSRHVWSAPKDCHLCMMATRVDNVKGLFSFFKLCGELKVCLPPVCLILISLPLASEADRMGGQSGARARDCGRTHVQDGNDDFPLWRGEMQFWWQDPAWECCWHRKPRQENW